MKKILAAGLLAICLIAVSHQQASAWVNARFGIGLNWSRLLKFKLQGVQLPAFLPTGDLAESFEQPDDLTYIFKLRQNVKWHNIAPVHGRQFTADDVLFSFNRQDRWELQNVTST